MPIYEYLCGGCNKPFDRIVKAGTPDSEIACTHCGEKKAMKKISMFSFGSRSKSGDYVSAPSSGHSCGSCGTHHCSTCR